MGISSRYFPYYVLTMLAHILAGSVRRSVYLTVLGTVGILGVGIANVAGTELEALRDLAVVRVLQLWTIGVAAALAAGATGHTRSELAARTIALAQATESAAASARTDMLTGLSNRRELAERLPGLLADAARHGRPFSAVALDVDGMKAINDGFGHQAGDALAGGFNLALRVGHGDFGLDEREAGGGDIGGGGAASGATLF